jgi:cytochrome o ubiquinol oxidase subunit 1
MGATRRLYEVHPEWQTLFIIAAVGACMIGLAIFFQALQLMVSIKNRKQNSAGNDPWPGPAGGGRTLEWSISSPPPVYNFVTIPEVHSRDSWWDLKKSGETLKHVANVFIELPRNTPVGLFVAGCAFALGFGMVWHMWWLAVLSGIAIVFLLIIRSFDDNIEYMTKIS